MKGAKWAAAVVISAGLGVAAAEIANGAVAGVIASVLALGGFGLLAWELAPLKRTIDK